VGLYEIDKWLPDPPHDTRVTISDSEGTSFRRYKGAIAPVWDIDPDDFKYVSNDTIRTQVFSGTTYMPNFDSWSCKVDKVLRPKLEKASLGVAIAELRDLPHMLEQTSRSFHDIWKGLGGHKTSPLMTPKRVSEDFLNIQFGWIPFIKDVNDMLNVSFFGQQYIHDLTAANNTWQHRKATLSETEEVSILIPQTSGWRVSPPSSIWTQAMSTNYPGTSSPGRYSLEQRINTRVWASGDYKFYRPEFDDSLLDYSSNQNLIKQYMILYGIRLNPSVLYKATPWSWLVDWFSNLGDVVEGVTAAGQDGVVSQNLYTMHHQTTDLVFKQEINWDNGARTYEFHRPRVCKQRMATGNPFGFCLSASLSSKQLAILAALGISRRP
jgi:hypothetical protein